jgi:hypothetical protein
MIGFYTRTTPTGRNVSIMLEETGLEYTALEINIMEGDQNTLGFIKGSPNSKIPAIVDGDVTLIESGAILIYLAVVRAFWLANHRPQRQALVSRSGRPRCNQKRLGCAARNAGNAHPLIRIGLGHRILKTPIQIRLRSDGPPSTAFSTSLTFIGKRMRSQFGDALDIKSVWNIIDLGYRGADQLIRGCVIDLKMESRKDIRRVLRQLDPVISQRLIHGETAC